MSGRDFSRLLRLSEVYTRMSDHASDEEEQEEEEDDEDEQDEEEEVEEEAGEGAAKEGIKEPGAIEEAGPAAVFRQKRCMRWTTNMLSQLRVKLLKSQEDGADVANQWTRIAKEVQVGFVHVLAKNHGQGFRLSGAMVKNLFKRYASWRKDYPNALFEQFDPAGVQKKVRANNAAKARSQKASWDDIVSKAKTEKKRVWYLARTTPYVVVFWTV